MNKRRVFSREAKAEIAMQILTERKTLEEASREYEVREELLQKWMLIFYADELDAMDESEVEDVNLRALLRELKKATPAEEVAAYFASLMEAEADDSD